MTEPARTNLRHLATRVAELRDAGSSPIAASNALKVIEEMELSGIAPLRVDPVEDDALAFLFVRGSEQITVECFGDGEIVVGHSRRDPALPSKVVSITPDDPHQALTATNLVAKIQAERVAEVDEDRYERVCGEYEVEQEAHNATKVLLAQVRDDLAKAEFRTERAVAHGTEQEQLYWRAEAERARLQEGLASRDATLRLLRGLLRQAREVMPEGDTTPERLRNHSLEVRIDAALSSNAPERPPAIASPFGDRLPDALRPAFAEAAQALQDACAALGPTSDTGERCSEARIALLESLHDLPAEDAVAREGNTREELQNIVANEPLCPGDTLSHETADECVRRGWARRRRDGRYVATDEGIAVVRGE